MNTNLTFLNFYTASENKCPVNPAQVTESSRLASFRKNQGAATYFMDLKPGRTVFGLVVALMMVCILQPSLMLAQTCNNVTLSSQDQINDIASSCAVLGGSLTIRETTDGDIMDLTPLRSVDIENLGNLSIESNSMLESLDGLEGVKSIGSSITIYNNPSLKNVEGLVGMEQMRGYLNVYDNDSLMSINGFRNVSKNPWGFNGLNIIGNPALTSLDGLEGLKKWDDYIDISENAQLKDVDGLQGLLGYSRSSIGIYDNPALMDIDGLQNLITADYIGIWDNPMLINTDGLQNLITVDYIDIFDNAVLADFCGLYPFFSVNVDFDDYYFSGNAANPASAEIIADGPCVINPIEYIAQLVADSTLTEGQGNALLVKLNNCNLNAFNNQVNAFVNAGILTQEQGYDLIAGAEAYCENKSQSISQSSLFVGGSDLELKNYPNPFSGTTNISFTLTVSGKTTLKVYDTFGKEVAILFDDMAESGQQYTLEFSSETLSKGMYVYHLQSGNNVIVVKKMILMK